MKKEIKISNHAILMFGKRRKKVNVSLRKLKTIIKGVREGTRGILRVQHRKKRYGSEVCYLDYNEKLIFVFCRKMNRLITVRNDTKHFKKYEEKIVNNC